MGPRGAQGQRGNPGQRGDQGIRGDDGKAGATGVPVNLKIISRFLKHAIAI